MVRPCFQEPSDSVTLKSSSPVLLSENYDISSFIASTGISLSLVVLLWLEFLLNESES